jgi:phage I-like protein
MNSLTARACNQPLSADSGAPDWIQLLPAGPAIVGSDGRAWSLPDPSALVTAFAARNKPLVVDWEHASEHRAPKGLDAPAAGWVDRIEERAGAIYGHVEWTAKAAAQIAAKEYRFLSPVFTYRKADAAIVALTSAGLTNQPNLNLTALNQEQPPMDLALITAALGLSDSADIPAIVAAINALKSESAAAANRAETPPLDKFIPRADYDAALQRATNAEQQLATVSKERQATEITALVESALQAKKIIPATKDYYVAMCQTEGGIAAFKAFLDKAPPHIGEAPAISGKPVGTQKPTADTLTPEQRAICTAMGLDPAVYAKSLETTT